MGVIRLLIADDHQLFLDGIVSLLKDEPSFSIEATAEDGYQVLDLVGKSHFDVCLLDISMPKLDGIATARKLREKKPGLKIMILTTYNDREIIDEMTRLGVSGYVLKNCTKAELVNGIRKVSAGETYYSDAAQEAIIRNYTTLVRGKENQVILTSRELEILKLLAREYTNDRIASELRISYRTVETHRKNMMQKAKAHNLAGLLSYAYSTGIIR